MSYILDALKRADAERQRGQMPGLHTHNTPAIDAPPPKPAGFPWLPILGLLAAPMALGALWWWLIAPAQPGAATQAQTPTPLAAIQTLPAPEPASQPAREPAPQTLPILAPTPPRPPSQSTASPPLSPSPETQSATQSAPNDPPAAAPVPAFAELAPALRARLPAVNVSGSTYSKNPALRMLILNGKVVQEGDTVASGLTLERIEPRSAVLNHQGLRYRIGY